MAEKIISGDSLQTEFVTKFNDMADEVNELKESSGGDAVVELSGDSGTLTDEQYAQCILPNTTIKWLNGSNHIVYKYWKFVSPTYYFKSVYIDTDECINNTIEIDQINHSWVRKSTAYSGNGSGGSVVSVKQTLTSGTEIGSITVNGTETKLYAPEGSTDTTPAVINYVNALPTENIDTSAEYMVINKVQSWVGGILNQMPNPSDYLPDMLSGIPITVNMVDTLPSTGEYATDDYNAPTKIVLYYQKSDMELYAYMPEGKVPTTGETNLGNTWQKANVFLIGAFFITYRGFISSGDESEALQGHNNLYLFVSGECYRYKNGGWQNVEAESGSGGNSKVFEFKFEGELSEDGNILTLNEANLAIVDEAFEYIKSNLSNIASIRFYASTLPTDMSIPVTYFGGAFVYINLQGSFIASRSTPIEVIHVMLRPSDTNVGAGFWLSDASYMNYIQNNTGKVIISLA